MFAGLPIKIVIESELAVAPGTIQKLALFPIHDVALEGEAPVRFFASAPELRLLSKGENVVADNVLAPIMLMETAILGAINDVVFDQDLTAAFVGVDSPPP